MQYPLEGHHILSIPGTVRELAAEALFERDEDALTLATMVLDALLKVRKLPVFLLTHKLWQSCIEALLEDC